MDRRTFLNWVGVGAIATSLPMALAACAPESDSGSTATEPSGDFQPAGSVADLDQNGQILAQDGLTNPALIIRDPNSADTLIAVNPTCPHQGCDVAWQADQTAFICPCHDSRFAPTGEVTQGPATSGLTVYEARVEGEQVLVRS